MPYPFDIPLLGFHSIFYGIMRDQAMSSPDTILCNAYIYTTSVDIQDCPICYTIMAKGDKISVTPCNHSFHYNCMERWIQTISQRHSSYREGCPMCRGNLEIKHKYHDIAEQVAKRTKERREEIAIEKLYAIRMKEMEKKKERYDLKAFHEIFSENHKSRREYKVHTTDISTFK